MHNGLNFNLKDSQSNDLLVHHWNSVPKQKQLDNVGIDNSWLTVQHCDIGMIGKESQVLNS